MDPITLVIQCAFLATFAVAIWRYLHRRGPVELAVVAIFSSTVALFALTAISAFVGPGPAGVIRPFALSIFFAQPLLIVRLVGLISPLSGLGYRLALAGFAITTTALWLLGSGSAVTIALVVAYFGITDAAAAACLLRIARRRLGVPGARLRLAALATACFGLAIVVAGLAWILDGSEGSQTLQPLTRAFALIAGFGYLAAFVPPAWLARWAHRAVAFDQTTAILGAESLPDGRHHTALWAGLSNAAERILGARVKIDDDPAGTLPGRPAVERLPSGGTRVTIPFAADAERAVITADLDGHALFVDDDIELVALLGRITLRAVANARARDQLREAVIDLERTAAIQASEGRFRALLDAHPNAVLAVDAGRRIRWCSRATAQLFGVSEEGLLVGRTVDELVAIPPGAWLDESGSEPRHIETLARRSDGSSFPAEVTINSVDLDGGAGHLATVSDATWRREADQLRDTFISILSHELRTPITSIYGGAQVLAKRAMTLDEETRNDLLTGLADESERLQRMIENLLILAKVERGADLHEPRPILLDRVLPDVVERERSMWPSAIITMDVEPHVPVVSADEDYLAQVVRNLLANAVKYAGDRAAIHVAIRYEDPWVAVTVEDDGPGFPPEEADRIFDLYYRSPNRSHAPGAGIGLFVCRRLIEAMGGRMWASSEPGCGATFGFRVAMYTELEPAEPIEPVASFSDHVPLPVEARAS